MIKDHHLVDVFIGIDVGKSNHHAVAIDRSGKKLLDKALLQDEAKLRAIVTKLADHGTLLLIADLHPGESQNRCPGRGDHRRGRPYHAAHAALHGGRRRTGGRTDHALRLR